MATLQARLARGDPAAFAELYDTCADRMYRYLMVRLGSPHDAEDVLQETFCRLARMRQKLAKITDLDAYCIAVARNEAARLITLSARRRQTEERLERVNVFIPPSDADSQQAADAVAAALSRLADDLREVVNLKTFAGLTFQQISLVTGLPQGTVATRYRTALQKMRSWLARRPW